MGAKKSPFYRIVVADSRYPRDGRFIEEVGYYNPSNEKPEIKIDVEKAKHWPTALSPPTRLKVCLRKTAFFNSAPLLCRL